MGKVKRLALLGSLMISAVIVFRALTFPSFQPTVLPCALHGPREFPGAAERLAEAVRFETISHSPDQLSLEATDRFVGWLMRTYPRVHRRMERHVVNGHSVVFVLDGSDDTLRPFMLCGHLDVVPIALPEAWTSPPFAGREVVEEDGSRYVVGRGTLDNKNSVLGVLEAMEYLLGADEHDGDGGGGGGWRPKRAVIFAFGHDEEVGGMQGAGHISRWVRGYLQRRRARLGLPADPAAKDVEFVLDEGLVVTDGMLKGVRDRVAIVGTAEKGYLALNLDVSVEGGHSSMPRPRSSIGVLADAVGRLERSPFPSRLGEGAEAALLTHVASEMPFHMRLALANMWLFSGLISYVLSAVPTTNALVRTTLAVTMVEGGVKENVIAPRARAVVSLRLHPSDSSAYAIERVRQVIADERVVVSVRSPASILEPSAVSGCGDDDFGFQAVATSIRQVFPDVLVAPGVMIANTDTRHYWPLTDQIYRFCPSELRPSDLGRIHGVDERISVSNFHKTIDFYYHVLRNADGGLEALRVSRAQTRQGTGDL